MSKNNKISDEYYLNIKKAKVSSEKAGIELWIKINNQLSFENHISFFCWKASEAEVFCKKGVLRNFTKFTGKHLCQNLFFNKAALHFY